MLKLFRRIFSTSPQISQSRSSEIGRPASASTAKRAERPRVAAGSRSAVEQSRRSSSSSNTVDDTLLHTSLMHDSISRRSSYSGYSGRDDYGSYGSSSSGSSHSGSCGSSDSGSSSGDSGGSSSCD